LRLSPGRQQRQIVSREDLEKQIEAGDWAAVGATAAVLASDSRSGGGSSISSGMSSEFSSMSSSGLSSALSGTSRERARAAELDRLVEAGDWEAVVMTAAKFEADRDDKTEGSGGAKSWNRLAADRSLNLSANSPSVSTNISDSPSNNLKHAEMRAEVEALVRRVVPDEIDNVDEMMSQFRGREEELVETLRTMQERSIAARQREANRRNAKREAKKLAKEAKKASSVAAGLPPRSTPPRSTPRSPAKKSSPDTKSLVDSTGDSVDFLSVPSKGDSNTSDNTPERLALDAAIAAEDWEAVGRTAEQLGNTTDSSVNTSDFESADENDDTSGYLTSRSRPETERAAELEELIEDKDWSGVAEAANDYTLADVAKSKSVSSSDSKKQKSKSSSGSSGGWKIPFLSNKRKEPESVDGSADASGNKKTTKEEEEARAQAEVWMAIAEQSKAKGSTAIGASDAADWAISRSLKQIQDSSNDANQIDTHSVGSSNDDKSV